MPQSVTVSTITHNPDGSKSVTFSGGSGFTIADAADAQDKVDALSLDVLWKAIVCARYLANSPDLSNDNSVEGITLTFNPADNTAPVEIS